MSSIENFREDVFSKNPDLERLAERIKNSDLALTEALHNLIQKNETIRYNS